MKAETHYEALSAVWVNNDNGLGQSCDSRDDEKSFRYNLKVKPIAFLMA